MSPVRIKSQYYQTDGVKVTEIKEKADGFSVNPAEAGKILGMPRTTLFRYDGPDVQRETRVRGIVSEEMRVYPDEALLRIAIEGRRVNIQPDEETGLAMLSSEGTEAVLDIEWPRAQEKINDVYTPRGNKERS
jgi:hypothetical protein